MIYSTIFEHIKKEYKEKKFEYLAALNFVAFYIIYEAINNSLLPKEEKSVIWPIIVTFLFWFGGYTYRAIRDGIREVIKQG